IPLTAWRGGAPVYKEDRHIGHATTGAWSRRLKQSLALATVERALAGPGTELDMEVTVEYARKTVLATVVKTPFFDPPRKRALSETPANFNQARIGSI